MRRNRDNDDAEMEIEFFRVKVKGGNSTVEEAIKQAVTVAMERAVSNRRSQAQALPAGTPAEEPSAQQSLNFDEDDIQEGEIAETPLAKSTSNKASAKRNYPTPKPVEIDFYGAKVSLQDYCKSKNTSDTTKKYLVCAVWLKEQRDIASFTADHIYTCFRLLSWGVQKDFSSTLRSAKKHDYLRSGSAKGSYELTHIGEDAVRKLGST